MCERDWTEHKETGAPPDWRASASEPPCLSGLGSVALHLFFRPLFDFLKNISSFEVGHERVVRVLKNVTKSNVMRRDINGGRQATKPDLEARKVPQYKSKCKKNTSTLVFLPTFS